MLWARVAAAAILLISAVAPGISASSAHAAARTSSLPSTRLEFGLANDPGNLSWMTGSGVPWKYRYQYLSGGVNTTHGWETWNSPAGAFAGLYMSASSGARFIPVFSYYEICQSLPASCSGNQLNDDYNNLNNTSTMNAYYANFKLLMQQAHAFGQLVVVQVEPDLWGFMQQKAAGGNASTVGASVASSGFADVASIPDTLAGFGDALLHLRDLYATNVVLGIHASMWSSGQDVASSTDPSLNVTVQADATAAFLNSAGISSNPYGTTWDVVFNDVDDHDAAWWEAQGADNASFTHWWDPTNKVFPNFARYLGWVGELHARTGLQQVTWQVPEGNQYFLTENNTCGHYQDDIAQWFIGHPQSLLNAGLVAVLFGAGNGCRTNNTDVQRDGVTNNNGQMTSDLLGWCSACNTHTSIYSDDDGGYLRIFVGQYYLGGSASARVGVSQSDTNPPGARGANPSTGANKGPRIVQVSSAPQATSTSTESSSAAPELLNSLQFLLNWLDDLVLDLRVELAGARLWSP